MAPTVDKAATTGAARPLAEPVAAAVLAAALAPKALDPVVVMPARVSLLELDREVAPDELDAPDAPVAPAGGGTVAALDAAVFEGTGRVAVSTGWVATAGMELQDTASQHSRILSCQRSGLTERHSRR